MRKSPITMIQAVKNRYEYIDHTADTGIKVTADSFESLLSTAAKGFFNLIVDINSVKSTEEFTLTLTGDRPEEIFINWLRELLYLYSARQKLFSDFNLPQFSFQKHPQNTEHVITCYGETFDPDRHLIKTEVKLITYHQFFVKETSGIWEARVIIDI